MAVILFPLGFTAAAQWELQNLAISKKFSQPDWNESVQNCSHQPTKAHRGQFWDCCIQAWPSFFLSASLLPQLLDSIRKLIARIGGRKGLPYIEWAYFRYSFPLWNAGVSALRTG
jgi:hypothetical protein